MVEQNPSDSFRRYGLAMEYVNSGDLETAIDEFLQLLDHNPNPTETEIRFALAGNLCRCTGYDKIVRAVQAAAAEMRKG